MGKVPKNAVFALFDPFYQVIWKIDLFYLVGNFLENILKKKNFWQNCIFTPLWCHKGVKIAHFWPFSRKNRLYLIYVCKSICLFYNLYPILCKILWGFQKWYWKFRHITLWRHNDVIHNDVFCHFWPFLHKISLFEP